MKSEEMDFSTEATGGGFLSPILCASVPLCLCGESCLLSRSQAGPRKIKQIGSAAHRGIEQLPNPSAARRSANSLDVMTRNPTATKQPRDRTLVQA
jgi:hypothetical protein